MRCARGDRALRMDRVMQRLAENGEIDRAFRDRRIFDVAEPVFEIREAVLLRELRAELDHLRRVIDRDDLCARSWREVARASLRPRRDRPRSTAGSRADQRVRERLPRTARAHNCGQIFPRAHRNIRAPCPGVCASASLQRRAIARRLRHLAGQHAGRVRSPSRARDCAPSFAVSP